MPLMFTVFFLWAPSGLVIYWFVSNLWAIGQQYFTNWLIGPAMTSPARPPAERRLRNVGAGRTAYFLRRTRVTAGGFEFTENTPSESQGTLAEALADYQERAAANVGLLRNPARPQAATPAPALNIGLQSGGEGTVPGARLSRGPLAPPRAANPP
jgi:hypothetical protein